MFLGHGTVPRMQTSCCELLIIGAGFAGLRAARVAARRGIHVLVLERKNTLGEPVRTSGGSWISAMDALEIPASLYHPVRVAQIFSESEAVTLDYPAPPGCILHVAKLVRFLAEEARGQGAEIRTGVEAVGVLQEHSCVLGVETGQGPIHTDFLLDASGMNSFLARRLKGKAYQRYGLGYEVTLAAPTWPQEEIALWLGPPWAPAGYAWAFPEGEGRVRLGVGILRPDRRESPRQALEQLLNSDHPELQALKGDILDTRTGAIPSEPALMPLFGPGWMQVGDAASQASPLLGEGIRFSLEMGEVAGEAAAGFLQAARSSHQEKYLERYARIWETRYGAKFRLEHRLNRRLARLEGAGWDRTLRLLRSLQGELPLDLLRGDWRPRMLLGLAMRRPRLAWQVLQGLYS
jgi:digeranylgeranylglycerophospholipid reductase